MFRARTHRSVLAFALVMAGAAGPAAADDSWLQIILGSSRHRDHDRGRVVVGRPRVEHRRPEPERRPVWKPVEEAPCELGFTAYQAGDTVIVVAKGVNRVSGFATSLSACDARGRTPELILRNTAPQHCGAACRTAFEVTGSFQSCDRIHCLTVKVAGRDHQVAVTQVGRVS
jgi:hypothetical protein